MNKKNLQSATATNSYLRGLLLIPVGVLVAMAGLTNMQWGPFGHMWIFAIGVLAVLATSLLLTRYYNETYGRVTHTRESQVRVAIATAIGAIAVAGGGQVDWSLNLPIDASATAFALAMFGYFAVSSGLKTHHLIIWGALAAVGLFPLWGDVEHGAKMNVGLVLMGIASVVAGIFDHFALRDTLNFPQGLVVKGADAGK